MRRSDRSFAARAACAAAGLGLALLGAGAASAGEVEVVLSAARVVVGEHGAEQLVTTDVVRPGDVVEYRATYVNQGDGAVRGLTATLPIPVDTHYLGLTATPAEAVEASTDGVQFAPIPLVRKVVGADGRERWEPVPATEYRALRWRIGELAPNARHSVAARVVVPAPGVARRAPRGNERHALQPDSTHVAMSARE
jgi:hypothetical protein